MPTFIIHDKDGNIRYTANNNMTESYRELLKDRGEEHIELDEGHPNLAFDIFGHRVLGGILVKRNEQQLLISTQEPMVGETFYLKGLQLGSKLRLVGPVKGEYVVEEQDIDMQLDTPGVYQLYIDFRDWKPERIEIRVRTKSGLIITDRV